MEAGILSKQIENAQKKVEEQNFVARKNVLKYDDVMNTQRLVIYDQRRRVLEEDLSDEVRAGSPRRSRRVSRSRRTRVRRGLGPRRARHAHAVAVRDRHHRR